MQTVIETKALCKQYGPHTAVDHVELHVPQGCVYGFIGPNGAGKSTTMKMLLGLIHPTAGRVRLLGQELTEKSRLPLLRQTGSLIESPAGYLHLTAQENLEIVADLKGVPHKDIGRVLDMIVTDDGKAACAEIDRVADRGSTILQGHGGYGGQPKDVVLCACSNKQLYEIEHAVQAIDPGCFIIMLQSNEVHGEGFRQLELGKSESSESK